MKIVVISDTHGDIQDIIEEIKNIDDIDYLIHLGDYTKDANEIQASTNLNMIKVRGNCDMLDYSVEEDKVIEIMGKKIFLTHGHKYSVKSGIDRIYYKAKELGVHIVLFGHSHIPVSIMHEDILLFNPGSTSFPKGEGKKSYGIIEIDENVRPRIIYNWNKDD